jgi:hypothetical protein
MRFREHYERERRYQPDRTDITLAMCERVKNNPPQTREQEDGRIVYWGYVSERDRYLRVVVSPDGETIWTAHLDRNFRKKVERGEVPEIGEAEE